MTLHNRHPGRVPGSTARLGVGQEALAVEPADKWTPELVRGDEEGEEESVSA